MSNVATTGFTREVAEVVVGASLRVLAGLAHKSLLHWRPSSGGSGRYEIYELLRRKEIPSYKVGRLTRILREDAERWRETKKLV